MYTNQPGVGFWIMVEREMGLPVEERDRYVRGKQAEVFAYWAD